MSFKNFNNNDLLIGEGRIRYDKNQREGGGQGVDQEEGRGGLWECRLVSLHVILPALSPQPGTETIAEQLLTETKAETERQEQRQRHNMTAGDREKNRARDKT